MAQGIGQWEKEMLTWARAPASACTKKKKKTFFMPWSVSFGVWRVDYWSNWTVQIQIQRQSARHDSSNSCFVSAEHR
jgi:hypothetical protein